MVPRARGYGGFVPPHPNATVRIPRDDSFPGRGERRYPRAPGSGVPPERCPFRADPVDGVDPTPREHLAVPPAADEHTTEGGHVDEFQTLHRPCVRVRVHAGVSPLGPPPLRRRRRRENALRRRSAIRARIQPTRRRARAVSRDSRRVRDVVGSNPGGGGSAAPRAARCRFQRCSASAAARHARHAEDAAARLLGGSARNTRSNTSPGRSKDAVALGSGRRSFESRSGVVDFFPGEERGVRGRGDAGVGERRGGGASGNASDPSKATRSSHHARARRRRRRAAVSARDDPNAAAEASVITTRGVRRLGDGASRGERRLGRRERRRGGRRSRGRRLGDALGGFGDARRDRRDRRDRSRRRVGSIAMDRQRGRVVRGLDLGPRGGAGIVVGPKSNRRGAPPKTKRRRRRRSFHRAGQRGEGRRRARAERPYGGRHPRRRARPRAAQGREPGSNLAPGVAGSSRGCLLGEASRRGPPTTTGRIRVGDRRGRPRRHLRGGVATVRIVTVRVRARVDDGSRHRPEARGGGPRARGKVGRVARRVRARAGGLLAKRRDDVSYSTSAPTRLGDVRTRHGLGQGARAGR